MIKVPTDYRASAPQARETHGELADIYLEHTWVGDPLADAVVESLAEMPAPERTRLLKRAIDGELDREKNPPAALERLMEELEQQPDWVDWDEIRTGCFVFNRYSETFLATLVTSIILEGFCTYISKSFMISGGLMDRGVKRLRQNNRHLVEIFLPGGLDRHGDGWKLSVRIRLVHAQIRHLLRSSPDWDSEAWGTPISTAHMAYACSAFSARLLQQARKLGARPNARERHGFMQVWRYSSHLLGVPDALLPKDEQTGLKIRQAGWACEPPISLEAKVLVHSIINSAPLVANPDTTEDRQAVADYVARVARAMLGRELADELNLLPGTNVFGVLALFRGRNMINGVIDRLSPSTRIRRQSERFAGVTDASHYSDSGLEYQIPDHVHAESNKSFS